MRTSIISIDFEPVLHISVMLHIRSEASHRPTVHIASSFGEPWIGVVSAHKSVLSHSSLGTVKYCTVQLKLGTVHDLF